MNMSIPDTFPLFSALPSELRLAIWHHAFSGPVTVSFEAGPKSFKNGSGITVMKDVGPPIFTPNHTHVGRSCRGAWDVMVTTHEPALFESLAPQSESVTYWIDYPNTTFHLGSGESWKVFYKLTSCGKIATSKIEKLVLQYHTYRETIEVLRMTNGLTGLKSVEILAGPPGKSGPLYDDKLQGSVERFLGRLFRRIGKPCPKVEIERPIQSEV